MQRLACFGTVIYDANCLVSYCFYVDVLVNRTTVNIDRRETAHTRQVTEVLKANKQKVTTTQAAFEEVRNCTADAVRDRMAYREIEAKLGYPQGVNVDEQIILKVTLSVAKKVKKLETNDWFYVDSTFIVNDNALNALKIFFSSQDREKFGKSKVPSEVDMGLINFGYQRKWPLVTNDRGISNFAQPLSAGGLAFSILNLMEIKPPTAQT